MDFTPLHIALNNRLADLYFSTPESQAIVKKSGMQPGQILWTGKPITDWFFVITYAEQVGKLPNLIAEITSPEQAGSNDEFLKDVIKLLANKQAPLDTKINEDAWIPEYKDENLEKLMGKVSTLLPISFLEKGLLCAKAVARVEIGNGLGTGFLIKDNYLITNNHVIPDIAIAKIARIGFNYQKDVNGLDLMPDHFYLDPEADPKSFITSKEKDFTFVKIKGDANSKYGQLEISTEQTKKEDFVNIIQHPSGGHKQIAMYNNVVTYSDDNIIQYLTDTMPGSSGSPVFNSEWKIAGLHHAGGWVKEPGLNKPVYRNQGINSQVLLKALNGLNLIRR